MGPIVLLNSAGAEAAAEHAHEVPLGTTLLFAAVLVAMILALALEEKLHAKKSVITAVFAVVCLFLATVCELLPFGPVVTTFGERVSIPVFIPAVDWNVIAIILGSSIFVDVTSKSGLFNWIAIRLTKASGGDPRRLLWLYGVMTVVFSAVLNNVTAMIIVGSLTAVSLEKLEKRDQLLGFLLVEGLLTNVGGLLTLISSVPNIIVGTTAGIGFLAFFLKAAPYVVLTTAATIALGAKLFRIEALATDADRVRARERVAAFDESETVESVAFFRVSAVAFLAFIGVIATASVLPFVQDLGLGYVAMAFAAVMLIHFKATADRLYAALDWDLLGFFLTLFIVINTMEHAQVLALIGTGLTHIIDLGPSAGPGAMLVSSALFSSVTDNIPLAAMLAKILSSLGTTGDSSLWWAVIFGANLGGNLTPIGSASTLVAVTIIHRNKLPMNFARFVSLALPYAALHIVLATIYVLIVA